MQEIIIDGMLHGTGIRDKYEGGYLNPQDMGLSYEITLKLNQWLLEYEQEHYNEYSDKENIKSLDSDGIEIAREIRDELMDAKVSYYSNGELRQLEM